MSERYAIITPAHNEAVFLPRVISGVAAQRVRPLTWLILDDRSTDGTWEILEEAASRLDFLKPVKISGPPGRRVGANVVHLFHEGWTRLDQEVDFLVKMDADVVLPPYYFAVLLSRFQADTRLGLASGKTYTWQKKAWVMERIADTHVTGACKTYRLDCLKEMGGLIPILGWDVLDVVQARRLGWHTRSYPDLPLFHLRLTGSAQGLVRANLSYGRSYYAMRAHPLFVLAKALYRALERPFGAGLLILAGYVQAALSRQPRLADEGLAAFLRREQLSRLRGQTWRQEVLVPLPLPRQGEKFEGLPEPIKMDGHEREDQSLGRQGSIRKEVDP
jgi:biofilm PGA synthesis N-glycosyltransferase PgaC